VSDGFFVGAVEGTAPGDVVELTGTEARHAAVVRRLRLGETVTVTDGAGRGVTGRVAAASPERVVVAVDEVLTEPPSEPPITVVQALPKNDRALLAVDLMTEVGVDRIVPWQAARSVVRWEGPRGSTARDKWVTAAREAAKQARRLRFPAIGDLASTAGVVSLVRDTVQAGGRVLIMHEKESVPVTACPLDPATPCVVVIGPEGGLTDDEVDGFRRAGGQTFSLGRTVLRTSTAGAVAITQVRVAARGFDTATRAER